MLGFFGLVWFGFVQFSNEEFVINILPVRSKRQWRVLLMKMLSVFLKLEQMPRRLSSGPIIS